MTAAGGRSALPPSGSPDGFRFVSGRVARLVLDRPQRRNAVTWEMMQSLLEVFDTVDAAADCSCLIIEGAGGEFCAGIDMAEVSVDRPVDAIGVLRKAASFLTRLEGMRTPVVSAVEGHCVGLGFEIALACDVIVASESARFGFGEIQKGLLPAAAVVRNQSWRRSHDLASLALSGDLMDAPEAFAIGLVDLLGQDPVATANDVAERLAAAAPLSMELARILLHRDAEDDYQAMAEVMPALLLTEDVAEGTRAFFEKRPPRFDGA